MVALTNQRAKSSIYKNKKNVRMGARYGYGLYTYGRGNTYGLTTQGPDDGPNRMISYAEMNKVKGLGLVTDSSSPWVGYNFTTGTGFLSTLKKAAGKVAQSVTGQTPRQLAKSLVSANRGTLKNLVKYATPLATSLVQKGISQLPEQYQGVASKLGDVAISKIAGKAGQEIDKILNKAEGKGLYAYGGSYLPGVLDVSSKQSNYIRKVGDKNAALVKNGMMPKKLMMSSNSVNELDSLMIGKKSVGHTLAAPYGAYRGGVMKAKAKKSMKKKEKKVKGAGVMYI